MSLGVELIRATRGMIDFCATRSTWILLVVVDRGIDERTAGLRFRHGIDGNQANDAAFDASTALRVPDVC
jgi:hypothetical protein